MGISEVRKRGLWTPQGEVLVQEKGVVQITRKEIVMLSNLHEFAQQQGISLVCKRCDSAITGNNNASTTTLAVACQCREWRFVG